MAACLWLVACASGPEPTTRKKRKKRSADESELSADDDRGSKKKRSKRDRDDDDDDDDDDDRPRKQTAERDETPAQKRARIKKRKQQEAEERKRREEQRRQAEDAEREKAAAEEERRQREDERRAQKKRDKGRSEDDDDDDEAEREEAEQKQRQAEAKKRADAEAKKRADAEAKKRADAEAKKRAKRPPPDEVEGPVIDMTGDEDAGPAPAGEPRAEAIPVPGVDGSAEPEPEPEAASPSAPASRTLSDRPLTLGKGKLEVHGGPQLSVLTLPGAMMGTESSTTTTSLALGASYGVRDDLEIGGDYAFAVSPGDIKGPLTLRAAYSLQRGKLDVALASAFAIDFETFVDPTTMASTTQTFTSLQLGGWVRYHASRKLTLFTGLPALPPSSVTLTKLALPLPPFTYQLQLGLSGGITRAIELPVGVGLQATPNIYMFATLNLAHIRIANTVNALLFKDFIPFALGAFYTKHKLDVGLVLSDDLKQGFDYLRLDTVVRYSL